MEVSVNEVEVCCKFCTKISQLGKKHESLDQSFSKQVLFFSPSLRQLFTRRFSSGRPVLVGGNLDFHSFSLVLFNTLLTCFSQIFYLPGNLITLA